MLDSLEGNLKRRAIVYSDIAKIFFFLVNLNATKIEIVQGVKLLKEAYPEDVDTKLINELLHFHLYVRQKVKGAQKSNLFPCLMKNLIKLCARKKFTQPFPMWRKY